MKLGIVGLPNVGKSTLFNAITNAGAQSANFPFCTIDPNVGVVAVPDSRLDALQEMYTEGTKVPPIVPAVIEFVDIAGLVKGASKGEGLGNKFLGNIRECDAIVHVVRCFENDDIIHVEGSIDPLRDIETIDLELIFSDMEMVERRIARVTKDLKGDKSLQKELDFLKRLQALLEEGKAARALDCDEDEVGMMGQMALLTSKPIIYAANLSEDDFVGGEPTGNPHYQKVAALAAEQGAEVLPICAQMEADIVDMDAEEKLMFLSELAKEHELPQQGPKARVSFGRRPRGYPLRHRKRGGLHCRLLRIEQERRGRPARLPQRQRRRGHRHHRQDRESRGRR